LLLILVGTALLVLFDTRFEFSGLLLVIAGTLVARMRLGWRLRQDPVRQRRRSVAPVSSY
jgi:hypothetical protein